MVTIHSNVEKRSTRLGDGGWTIMTTNHPVPTPPPAEPAPSLRPVEELQALCDRATPGPWSAADEHGLMPGATPAWCVSRMDGEKWLYDVFYHASQSDPAQSERDSEFIAAARTALPSLLARLRAAEETLADFAEHGLRADLNPTMDCRDTATLYAGFAAYLRRIDESVRERAAALAEGASR